MHIPSHEIYQQLALESSGVWFVPTIGTDTHAILIKLSSNALKSVLKGSKVKFGFSLRKTPSGQILLSILYVYDDLLMPSITIGPEVNRDQQVALLEILRDRESTPIYFYDELARNVAEAKCKIHEQRANVIQMIADSDDLYAGSLNTDVIHAIDQTEEVAGDIISKNSLQTEHIHVTEVTLYDFREFELHTVGSHEKATFTILDEDEGTGLEKSLWHLLLALFPDNIYRSPQVLQGTSKRELTDILAISAFGTFLFESKSLAILTTAKDQTTARRAKNIEGHIRKALKQLVGATKSVQDGRVILTRDDRVIDINRNVMPHGIVLISELFPAVDWDAMFLDLARTTIKSKVILHVLDLRELAHLVMNSGTANLFDYYPTS